MITCDSLVEIIVFVWNETEYLVAIILPFIVTMHLISVRVHFSTLIIGIFGPATPTEHGWPLQYLYIGF